MAAPSRHGAHLSQYLNSKRNQVGVCPRQAGRQAAQPALPCPPPPPTHKPQTGGAAQQQQRQPRCASRSYTPELLARCSSCSQHPRS